MSPVLHKRKLREIEMHLDAEVKGVPSPFDPADLLAAIRPALKPKRSVIAAKKRVRAKKAERQDEWAQIREKVLERADGKCESPGCGWSVVSVLGHYPLEVDHMFGGSNRRTLQSIFTCWAICRRCHRMKTNNDPDAGYWLKDFIAHCDSFSYGHPEPGYIHAADIAKARLESLQIQGRAEPEPDVPVFGLLAKYAKPSTERDWDVGGPRDEEIAASRRAGNTEKRRFERERAKKNRR